MTTKDVHVVVSTSPNYEHIYKYFKRSFQNAPTNIKIHEYIINMDTYNNDGSFKSDGWYYACRQRIVNFLNFLQSNPTIRYAIFSDADINYLNPSKLPDLVTQAEKHDLDYYGMREYITDTFNGGFYVLKNSDKTHVFLKHIIERLEHEKPEYADQSIINNLLVENNIYQIKHDFIPTDLYVWGDADPSINAIFHHAVGNSDKVTQIERVQEKYKSLKKQQYEHYVNAVISQYYKETKSSVVEFSGLVFMSTCLMFIILLIIIKQTLRSV